MQRVYCDSSKFRLSSERAVASWSLSSLFIQYTPSPLASQHPKHVAGDNFYPHVYACARAVILLYIMYDYKYENVRIPHHREAIYQNKTARKKVENRGSRST